MRDLIIALVWSEWGVWVEQGWSEKGDAYLTIIKKHIFSLF